MKRVLIFTLLLSCNSSTDPVVRSTEDVATDQDASSFDMRFDAPDTVSEAADASSDLAFDAPIDVDAASALPACVPSLPDLLSDVGAAAPARDSGIDPTVEASRIEAVQESLHAARERDWQRSSAAATGAGYRVCATDSGEAWWIPNDLAEGLPLILLRPGLTDGLVIEHPHPFFDGTFDSVEAWWEASEVRASVISGHHRCASSLPSDCDGSTSVCAGTSSPYPMSDPAHWTGAMFHAAHTALTDDNAAVVVSVHGTAQQTGYVSDGTRGRGLSDNLVARTAMALAAELPAIEMRSCDEYDPAVAGPWLCGTTNVQGRHLNGAADACTNSADVTTGRFLHLEQPSQMRDRPADVVSAIVAAIGD